MEQISFGILTVSDSCFNGLNVDASGEKLADLIKKTFPHSLIMHQDIVPDDVDKIKEKLVNWSDKKCNVILTTGGTGLAPRDVTPEATKQVIDKEIPGITYAMFSKSFIKTPFAMLSRAVSGIRNKSLIINFPGSVKAVTENFETVSEIIPHAVSLITDDINQVKSAHKQIQEDEDFSPSKVKVNAVANRDRQSKYKMFEVSHALNLITANCSRTSDVEVLNINNALGRVLAEDVQSVDPLPPFPASIKDGYAVKAADEERERIVCDVKAAGDDPNAPELQSGYCVRISTGAPVPPGADAVVQVEDTKLISASEDMSTELKIKINDIPIVGQDIRSVGSDIPAHSIILRKGDVLNAAELGILAAIGKINVKVYKRPSIGIISSGNELQEPNEILQPGRIRDSNKITLINLLKQYSYDAKDCGIAKDTPTAVKHALTKAFKECDFVITTGGVSMGEYDVVKQVLIEDFGATIHFGRVNMKPGKPTTFATCFYKGNIKIIFGLPGNPVSATTTCLIFVIPALKYMENIVNYQNREFKVYAEDTPRHDLERPDYQRVSFSSKCTDSIPYVKTTGNQISSRLNSFAKADALMLVQPNNGFNNYRCYLINKY